jgi:formylglycine-generating enzyme required for sulfatase activity
MNKLYYLLIILLTFFLGCREHTSEAITDTTISPTYDTVPETIPIKDPIIGNSIIINNLEIAQNDFPNLMNWDAAKKACAALGNGWRLPEKFELEMIYENKDKIGGFADMHPYWSISEKDFVGNYIAYAHRMGNPFNVGDFWFKKVEFLVRAVRSNTGVAQTSNEIIGKPFKIDNFEVAQNDFRNKMNWDDAKKACAALGNGWRLPTKDEMYILSENSNKIGEYARGAYWSSTEDENIDSKSAWLQHLDADRGTSFTFEKEHKCYIRAVRFNTGVAQTSEEIIGKPFKIDNIEVAQNDFRNKMNWDDAKKACAALGNGWRLPTKDEMNILNENSIYIKGFSYGSYWTSTEYDDISGAWYQNFSNSKQYNYFKYEQIYVRAVRTK